MFEDEVRRELQSEPVFELDDQIDRICRIETQPSKIYIRVDGVVREIESASQVFDTPLSDLGFAWNFRPQPAALFRRPENPRDDKGGSLTAGGLVGQGVGLL
jgi:hypothetical protein